MSHSLANLDQRYASYSHSQRIESIFKDFERVLITSSFGTTSAIFLHLLHKIKPDHPVYFIDTRYLFGETHAYKQILTQGLGLNVTTIYPKENEHMFTKVDYTWAHHPDLCCHFNKVMPMEELKQGFDVWISGMIGGTTSQRSQKSIFRQDHDILRFYPLIDMDATEAQAYKLVYDLPTHPLEIKGFGSVGCSHCTRKGQGRKGRWSQFNKTECGLHIIQAKA